MNARNLLFSTVPEKDYIHLYKNGELDCKKVVSLLNYSKEEISAATNIPTTSIRYDEKIPKDLKERLVEWAIALNLVASFFKDQDKTLLWFRTPNPLLGDIAPRDMIIVGRFNKLLKFIQIAVNENHR